MNWAIVGTNWLCEIYRDAISLAGDRVTAVVSRDPDRARAFAGTAGRGYGSLAEMRRDTEIDAVYLCLPNTLHAAAAIQCLHAGKHVLCEKPLTVSPDLAREMFRAADGSGRVLAEAVMSAYSPAMPRLRRELQSGRVLTARLDYCQRSSKIDRFRAGERITSLSRDLGGGALLDMGVYPVHFAANLFGRPEAVTAAAQWEGGVDVTDSLLLRYRDFDAAVTTSKACQSRIGSEILLDDSTLVFENVSVVIVAKKLAKNGSAEEIDCGPSEVPKAGEASGAARGLVQSRVIRAFDAWMRGEDLQGLAHLRGTSLICQDILHEALRQTGYLHPDGTV